MSASSSSPSAPNGLPTPAPASSSPSTAAPATSPSQVTFSPSSRDSLTAPDGTSTVTLSKIPSADPSSSVSHIPAASPPHKPSDLPPQHPRPSALTTFNPGDATPFSSLPSSETSSLTSSPAHASASFTSSSTLNPPVTSTLVMKTALTGSMSDSARVDPPKPFPYQPSKQQKEGEEEWVILEATPADPRFQHETVRVQVSKADAAYQLQPIHCGRQVVFLNAQNLDFYRRELKAPSLNIWILCGLSVGQSHGLKRLFESGWRQNIQVLIMEVNKFELVASKDGLENILYEGKAVELPDAIFNRVGASVSYFGLAVLRQLENMGCLILNSLRSIEISRDKMLTVQHLAAHGLPIPKTILAKFPMNLETIRREFEYPIIIKKVSGSQGKGIIKVDSHAQLEDLVDMLDTGKPLIFQEFIAASSGKDLRVFVIGGRVVGAMMRVAAKGNFKANVHQGGSVKPVKISPQVEWLVLETVRIVGLDIAGVDLLIDKNTYKICEVNSSPGFEGLEKALGENIAIKMFLYCKIRLGVWRRGGKLGRGITVPVQEDDGEAREDNGAGAGGGQGGGGGGGGGEGGSEGGGGAGGEKETNAESKDSERDRFKTQPRNRSMKRTSTGQH